MPTSETQTLTRAIAILDCFSPEQPQLGVREIARRLDLSRSTVGRLLATLCVEGVLTQDPATRQYLMGPKVLTWSALYTGALNLRDQARPTLEELHRLTRETVNLYVLDGTERVCADRIESPERVRVVVRPGERMPLHAGSAGKAILAFASPDLIKRVLAQPLEKMTRHTIVNRRALLKELTAIRARGYAISRGERFEDALGLAAPVFDSDGNVIAALNVAGPNNRFTDALVARFAPRVMQLAAQISRALGYQRTKDE
ncbi:MAG: IclR family transcriptional regulator [Chloroflexi bacterium]|nr:IclR family transcriptional regulator [Chloroflexota bacterium]